jgi:uncharacterized protein
MEIFSSRQAWTRRLEEEVRRQLAGESSGHDPAHAFRVRGLALRIAAAIDADLDVVEAAALLHDVGHPSGRADHAQRGASLATDILSQCDFPGGKLAAVAECIAHHHWQPEREGDPVRPTFEYQAFADADRLDALGAVGIARAFAFGGAHHRPIWDSEPGTAAPGQYGISSIHHFYDKLFRLPGDMYTEPGRRLAARRIAVMEEFLRSFYLEWEGKDADITTREGDPSTSLDPFTQRTTKVGDRSRRISAPILQPDPIN